MNCAGVQQIEHTTVSNEDMAVSGRKISDLQGSISKSSTEDLEETCGPCLSDGQNIEAQVFCVECDEFLCMTCLNCHKKTRALKHHQLLDKDKLNGQVLTSRGSDICNEKCTTHRNEVIKFYCPKHESLGCHDCMTLNHRTCALDYIPDKCTGVGDSEEYRETLKNVEQQMKEADAVMEKAAVKKGNIDDWHDSVIKDIITFRKEINDHLDKMQKKIEANADKIRSTDKQEIQAVLDSLSNFTLDMKKLQATLIDMKAENQNGQLFIALKQAKSNMKSDEIQQAVVSLDTKDTRQLFECNKQIENILSTDSFGKLTSHKIVSFPPSVETSERNKTAVFPVQKKVITTQQRYTRAAGINIKMDTDSQPSDISACVSSSFDQLILADYSNKKLKFVDTRKKVVAEEKVFDSSPYGVTMLPGDQIAVTFPDKENILIMKTIPKLSVVRSTRVIGRCRGITCHEKWLYVVCCGPHSVLILDMKGNVKTTLALADKAVFESPSGITLSRDGKLLYISDDRINSIVSITLQGEISAVYKDLNEPQGLLMLDSGLLMVCCYDNTVHCVEANLKQGYRVMTGLLKPKSICYSSDKSEVYIGGYKCDHLKEVGLK